MVAPLTNPNVRPLSVKGGVPKEGPACVPIALDFTQNTSYNVDLTQLYNNAMLSQVLAVFADNSANSSPLKITIPDSNQVLVWPAYSQGYIPVMQSISMKFICASAGAFVVNVEFLNFPIAAGVWSANGTPILTASGAINVVDSVLEGAVVSGIVQTAVTGNLAYTNRSGTITTGGTAQNAMAANAIRRAFQLQNISTGDLWYSFVGAAAINGSGSFKLVSGAYYESAPGLAPNSAVSIIGATSGQAFSAQEA